MLDFSSENDSEEVHVELMMRVKLWKKSLENVVLNQLSLVLGIVWRKVPKTMHHLLYFMNPCFHRFLLLSFFA